VHPRTRPPHPPRSPWRPPSASGSRRAPGPAPTLPPSDETLSPCSAPHMTRPWLHVLQTQHMPVVCANCACMHVEIAGKRAKFACTHAPVHHTPHGARGVPHPRAARGAQCCAPGPQNGLGVNGAAAAGAAGAAGGVPVGGEGGEGEAGLPEWMEIRAARSGLHAPGGVRPPFQSHPPPPPLRTPCPAPTPTLPTTAPNFPTGRRWNWSARRRRHSGPPCPSCAP